MAVRKRKKRTSPQFIVESRGRLFITLEVLEVTGVDSEPVLRAQFDNAMQSGKPLRASRVDIGGHGPISVNPNPPKQ
jgi:hypothetical protein